MDNALKFFSKKSLLEIDNFEIDSIRNRFHELADVLLNQSILEVNKNKYRVCEIEFYVHSNSHQDPYVHKHPDQLKFGNWYFHQIETKTGYTFKGGNYKGLDLTLGDGKNFVGVLIRGIESLTTGNRFDGPSLVVDEILSSLHAESVAVVTQSNELQFSLTFDSSLDSREYFMGPRVGLRPNTDRNDGGLQFLFMPFRYLTNPTQTKKGKSLLFLHQASLFGVERAVEKIGIRDSEAKKYMNWFESGLKLRLSEMQFGSKTDEQCIFFGAHFAHFNSMKSDETIEVTPEQLHTMAVEAFNNGDSKQLKYFCDLGVDACGNEGLGLEFLKLRGIYFAQNGEISKAKHDFLSALEVASNDEVTFVNYITACLQSEDRNSANKAIKLCYSSFDGTSKAMVLETISEAIKVGSLSVEELPEQVIEDLVRFLKIKKVV